MHSFVTLLNLALIYCILAWHLSYAFWVGCCLGDTCLRVYAFVINDLSLCGLCDAVCMIRLGLCVVVGSDVLVGSGGVVFFGCRIYVGVVAELYVVELCGEDS